MTMSLTDPLCYHIGFKQRIYVWRERLCVCVFGRERFDCLLWGLRTHRSKLSITHRSITLHTNMSLSTAHSVHVCESIQLQKFWLSLVVCYLSLLPKPQWDIRNALISSNSIWAATRLTTKPLRRTGTNTANKCGNMKWFQWHGGLQWVNCQCDFNLWYHFIHFIVIYSIELVITGVAILI